MTLWSCNRVRSSPSILLLGQTSPQGQGLLPWCWRQQVGERDGLVAVRAEAAWAYAAAEEVAVGTTLLTQETGLAGRAFIDRRRAGGACGDRKSVV